MSDIVSLIYDDRDRTGKGGARALRREGWLPAIIYGGKGEPKKVAVSAREVKRELEMNPRFFSSIVGWKEQAPRPAARGATAPGE